MTKDDLVAFLKKSPVVVACGALSVALIAVWYFRSDNLPEAETRLQDKTAEADRYAGNLKNAAHLKEEHEILVAANKAIDGRAIHATDFANNAGYFYKVVSETGVTLLDARQTTPGNVAKPAKGSFVPVAFAVAAEGTWPQLLAFLRQIESGEHYSRITTATCSVNVSKRNAPLTLALTVELLGTP